ncbi:MAG: hypothetical protein H6841_09620 [Planctomycetes bacterium]|nr:hypothetical protein [Planctomycetota bacterium]MCB9935389.1 hypothetical protein [Planctomycetota bacterium]
MTGLLYFRTRHYDPTCGRFVSRDSASDPAYNLYSYTGNSPASYTDPHGTGLFSDLLKPFRRVFRLLAEIGMDILSLLAGGTNSRRLATGTVSEWRQPNGSHAWEIHWYLTAGWFTRFQRRQNWVIQRIHMFHPVGTTNCATPPQTGGFFEMHYLEAWEVHFLAGVFPFVTTNDIWDNVGGYPGMRGEFRQIGDAIWVGRKWSVSHWPRGGATDLAGNGAAPWQRGVWLESADPGVQQMYTAENMIVWRWRFRSNVVDRYRNYKFNNCP